MKDDKPEYLPPFFAKLKDFEVAIPEQQAALSTLPGSPEEYFIDDRVPLYTENGDISPVALVHDAPPNAPTNYDMTVSTKRRKPSNQRYMDETELSPVNRWLRWIAVLPGAALVGFLVNFPLHWVLYFSLAHGETISGVNIVPIEHNLSPFLVSFVYILAGQAIAPARKFEATLVLAAAWVVAVLGVLLYMPGQFLLEPRAIGGVLGVFLGIYIVWAQSRERVA